MRAYALFTCRGMKPPTRNSGKTEDLVDRPHDKLHRTGEIDHGQEGKDQNAQYPVRSNLPNREQSLYPEKVTGDEQGEIDAERQPIR